MTVKELLKGRADCSCGTSHVCPIREVVIEEDALSKIPALTADFSHVLLVADENTYRACGEKVASALGSKLENTLIYQREGLLVPNEEAIAELRAKVSDKTDLIVGVGSGVINDLCKHVSFAAGLPYDIVATAPSMDGYASKGAALILDGMKVTLNAAVPRAIIADVSVLANAPFPMIQAGYGDIIGKYSCLCDWALSALVTGEALCSFVYDATMEAVEKTVALSDGLMLRSHEAVAALQEALVAVGILMAYVGNSRPASGSEHHLSHYFEIVGIVRGEEYYPHGIDVCYSAVETARLRERLAAIPALPSEISAEGRDVYEQNVRRIYGPIADEVLALQAKMGWYDIDRIPVYREKWQEIRALLASAPDSTKMRALVEKIGLDFCEFTSFYGEEKIADALLYAKDLKDRYTVLWLYYDLFGCVK